MALNKTTLKTRMETEAIAQGFNITDPNCSASKLFEALANAIIDELTIAAVVSTVTTCGAGAGTGVGTIT